MTNELSTAASRIYSIVIYSKYFTPLTKQTCSITIIRVTIKRNTKGVCANNDICRRYDVIPVPTCRIVFHASKQLSGRCKVQ